MACTIVDLISDDMSASNRDDLWWLHINTGNIIQTADWLALKLTNRYLHTFVTLSKNTDLVVEHLLTADSKTKLRRWWTHHAGVGDTTIPWMNQCLSPSIWPGALLLVPHFVRNWSVQAPELHVSFVSPSCSLWLKQTHFPKHLDNFVCISSMTSHSVLNLLNRWISWFKVIHLWFQKAEVPNLHILQTGGL